MLVVSLLFLSICIGVIILSIHNSDDVHQILFILSALIAIICAFILTPIYVKVLLVILLLNIGNKLFSAYKVLGK